MTSSARPLTDYRLHAALGAMGAGGVAWLAAGCILGGDVTVCPFKLLTGLPCPACGSTRAVLAVLQGGDVLRYNPLGLVTTALMLGVVTLVATDLATGRDRLTPVWRRAEHFLKQSAVAVPLGLVLAANWMWTIAKGL